MCVSYGIRISWPLLLITAFNATVVSQSHANAKKSKNEAVMGSPLLVSYYFFYSKDTSIFGLGC